MSLIDRMFFQIDVKTPPYQKNETKPFEMS